MAAESGIALQPFEEIVNVHWGGGLAVEFGDQATDAPKPPKKENGDA